MFSYILGFVFVINIILILVMIFLEKKEPVYIFAWTLFLTFIPLVGFVVYLMFGNGARIRKRKNYENKKEWDAMYHTLMSKQLETIQTHKESESQYASLMEFNLNSSKSLVTIYNEVKIYTNGKEKYEDLLKDIESAKESIHMFYYIFNTEGIGAEVIRLLEKKASQGVEVRLVYDDVGSLKTKQRHFKKLIENGGEVYPFFAAKFKILGLNMNYRNHRKIVVIDSEVGYIGGMNIGDEYMSMNPKLSPWRDTHLRVRGEVVNMLQIRFLQDFTYAAQDMIGDIAIQFDFKRYFHQKDWSELKPSFMQIVASGPDTNGEELKDAFVKMIYSAQQCVDIQTPYFVPDAVLLGAIRTAALSGVKVRLMVPKINDNHFVDRVITSHIKELLDIGVEVYMYKGFIHGKTLTIDHNITTIGTANLDIRSFKLNFEVNAFIYNREVAGKMTAIYEEDIAHSYLVTMEDEEKKKWYVKAEESVYRLLSLVM